MKNKIVTLEIAISLIIFAIMPITAKNLTFTRECFNYKTQKFETVLQTVPYLDKNKYISNSIYIKFKKNVDISSKFKINTFLSKFCSKELILNPITKSSKSNALQNEHLGLNRIFRLTYADDIDAYSLCELLSSDEMIEYAVPIFKRELREVIPNDELLSQQWYLPAINMDKAFELQQSADSVIIGIVDSGSDILHPDLIENLWLNKDEIPDDGIDNDNNGYIDDINGWDFIGDIDIDDAINRNFKPDNNPKPYTSNNSHGSTVAGVAGAVTNNSIGIASPASKCQLMIVKCTTDDLQYNDVLTGFEGILYAAQNGADIINCSWGGPGFNPAELDMLQAAIFEYKAIIVASTINSFGNFDNEADYPIAYGNVIGVSAFDSGNDFRKAGFGTNICIFAPGYGILSTKNGGHYGRTSGTSLATPLVSSVAALIKARTPEWGYNEIYHQIRSSAIPFDSMPQEYRKYWFGKLDAYGALVNNQNKFQAGKSTPGLSIKSIKVGDKQALTSPGENKVNFVLKNYLSEAEDITVKFTCNSPHLSFKDSIFNISKIQNSDSVLLSTILDLKESNPWFSAEIKVFCEYFGKEYYNCEYIKIPIELQTSNRFRLAKEFQTISYPRWLSAHSLSNNYLFTCGFYVDNNFGTCMRWGGGGDIVKNFAMTIPVSIFGLNKDEAVIGTMNVEGGNPAMILKVNFATGKVDTTKASNYFNDVHKIFMYNYNNGIALGSLNSDNIWQISKTSNSAKNWQASDINIKPLEDENSFWAAYYCDTTKLTAFGTSKGRIIYTKDLLSWKYSQVWEFAKIELITFINQNEGICIYSDNRELSNNRFSAFTTDGGETWTRNDFNFYNFGTTPLYLTSPNNCGYAIIQGFNGEVYISRDLGKSWQPRLSWEVQPVMASFAIKDNDRIKVWQLGNNFYYLDFLTGKSKINSTLSSLQDVIDFGNFSIDSLVTRECQLLSNGDDVISIYHTSIDQADVFSLTSIIPAEINGNSTLKFNISAVSKIEGEYNSIFRLISDANEIQIPLKAKIIDYSSINDTKRNLSIYPLPAKDFLYISSANKAEILKNIKIINTLGKIVFEKTFLNSNFTELEITNFEKGLYFAIIETNSDIYHKKFIVNK